MKILFTLLGVVCLLGQSGQANAESLFKDTESFTLAKAVKIGRNASTSGQANQKLGQKMDGILLKCDTGAFSTEKGCVSCSSAIPGCKACNSATQCTTCSTGYILNGKICETREAEPDNTCTASNTFSWNANGSKSVPSGYSCVDGYGANASISMPSGANYTSTNIRFWDYATVSGAFTTKDLKSLSHTSWYLDSLDTVITFSSPVTVTGSVYLQEASTGGKGVSMKFNGGLKGSPSCVVRKMKETTGCGWASCSETVATDSKCSCSTTECKIQTCAEGEVMEGGKCVALSSCNVWDDSVYGLTWNANGNYTIPAGKRCWNGYGANSNITVPNGAVYDNVTVRFWDYATVNGSFTTRSLSSLHNTSGHVHVATRNTVITFKNPVTVTGTIYLQQSSVDKTKGTVYTFEQGLKGSPKCVLKQTPSQYAGQTDSAQTCSCSTTQCYINP